MYYACSYVICFQLCIICAVMYYSAKLEKVLCLFTHYCSGVNIDLMNFALNKSKKYVSNGNNI